VILAQVNTLRYELDTISQRIAPSATQDESSDKDALLIQQSESSRRLLARLEKIRQGATSTEVGGTPSSTAKVNRKYDYD
jgi:hypothetical protein